MSKTKKTTKTKEKAKAKTTKTSQAKKDNKNLAKKILEKKSEQKKQEAIETTDSKASDNILKKIIVAKKPENSQKLNFKVGEYAVYPSHGIGKIINIESITIGGEDHSCYEIFFEREKLTIKAPVKSVEKIGMRHIITKKEMDEVFSILRSGIKKLKGMWSRRAQEYETKINSGDITLLAEVLRDLTRDIDDADRSYSERIIYETAISRLAAEYAAIYDIDFEEAKEKVILTAKDKLESDIKVQKQIDDDEFDNFVDDDEDSEDEDEDDEDEEEYEDEDDD